MSRTYTGLAMPHGAPEAGFEGPTIMLTGHGPGGLERVRMLDEEEARAIRDALGSALRTLETGRRISSEGEPTGARGAYPYRDHRNIEEVGHAV